MGVWTATGGTAILALALVAPRPSAALDLIAPAPFEAAREAAPADLPAPFRMSADPATRARAVECLADAVYYEASGEPRAGREAVAQVVLNRVRHPRYPKSVCGVVFEGWARPTGCQFTFTCDGATRRAPDAAGWRDAMDVATRALDGYVAVPVGGSTHYHTVRVHPAWSAEMTPTRRIGAHQFYRYEGALGAVAMLRDTYAGVEPAPPIGLATPLIRVSQVAATPAQRLYRAPEAALFSVWGLAVAQVSPLRDGRVDVLAAPSSP